MPSSSRSHVQHKSGQSKTATMHPNICKQGIFEVNLAHSYKVRDLTNSHIQHRNHTQKDHLHWWAFKHLGQTYFCGNRENGDIAILSDLTLERS